MGHRARMKSVHRSWPRDNAFCAYVIWVKVKSFRNDWSTYKIITSYGFEMRSDLFSYFRRLFSFFLNIERILRNYVCFFYLLNCLWLSLTFVPHPCVTRVPCELLYAGEADPAPVAPVTPGAWDGVTCSAGHIGEPRGWDCLLRRAAFVPADKRDVAPGNQSQPTLKAPLASSVPLGFQPHSLCRFALSSESL